MMMARQSALAGKVPTMGGNAIHKSKLNQSMNEGFGFGTRSFHNMFPNLNNLNQSLNMENEIQELYEQEDENNVIVEQK